MYKISDLSKQSQKEYLNSLKNDLISYKTKLNFSSNITFGVEIEYENLVKEYVDVYLSSLKYYNSNFKEWKNKTEIDISTFNQAGEEVNGEINSSILKNDKESWKNLKDVLYLLKNKGGYVSEISAGHIHIGSQILGNNINYWKTFLMLWIIFENEIIKFSSGEFNKIRTKQKYYAENLSDILSSAISEINNTNVSTVTEYINNIKNYIYYKYDFNIYNKKYAVYLKNIGNCKFKKGNSIEFRCPNATLDEAVCQNNINFFVNFLLASKKDIDIEKLIKSENNKTFELADLIFNNMEDKNNFLIQTLKLNKIYNKRLNYYSYK